MLERFTTKLNAKNSCGCVTWKGFIRKDGYGCFWYKGKSEFAHRVAWEIFNGQIPDNLCVLHKCDNRACCELSHLFLGTYLDNNADRAAKKRNNHTIGSKHPSAKLTEEDVKIIKKRISLGHKSCQIAKQYNIAPTQIYLIKKNKTWGHV